MPHCSLTNLKDLFNSLMCNLVNIIGPRQRRGLVSKQYNLGQKLSKPKNLAH